MAEQCPRCQSILQDEDAAQSSFCPVCGLPQLRMAEDAIAGPAGEAVEGAADGAAIAPNTTDWRLALRIVFLASIIGAVPAMLLPGQAVSGAVGGLVLVMTPLLALGCVSLYYRSRRHLGITPAIGGRLGAVLGLWLGCWVALGTGIAGFLLRYRDHSHLIDDRITEATSKLPTQMSPDAPLPPEILARIASPEFRASMFVLGHVVIVFLFIAIGAGCGALAGAALRARRQRHIA